MTKLDALPVHPLATVFPMLIKSELQDLADDIKENGQLHPIIISKIDGKDTLIDGRNRLAACLLAKVEPIVEIIDESEVTTFIVSSNLTRRNLTKTQQAILYAVVYPEPAKGGRGKKGGAQRRGFGDTTLKKARAIVNRAPDLVEPLITGTLQLDAARKALSDRENKPKDTRYETLCENAPDLAELVDNGDDINKVWAVYTDRLEAEAVARRIRFENVAKAAKFIEMLDKPDWREAYVNDILQYPEEFEQYARKSVGETVAMLELGEPSLITFIEELK